MSQVGYARVSTREQNPESQEAALRAAGCERVFVDRGESSRIADRPQWLACLDYLREGDTLVILALDRIAGTELMAIELIRDLGRRGVRLRSLTEPFLDVDTSTPMGKLLSASWPCLRSCACRRFGRTLAGAWLMRVLRVASADVLR